MLCTTLLDGCFAVDGYVVQFGCAISNTKHVDQRRHFWSSRRHVGCNGC